MRATTGNAGAKVGQASCLPDSGNTATASPRVANECQNKQRQAGCLPYVPGNAAAASLRGGVGPPFLTHPLKIGIDFARVFFP
jgi:hypothetical protein